MTNKNFLVVSLILPWLLFCLFQCNYPETIPDGMIDSDTHHLNLPSKKIWRHRVNTINDAIKYSQLYSGIEIDIVYNRLLRQFYCNHDSVLYPALLDSIFSALSTNDSICYWLDFKSANKGNIPIHSSISDLHYLLEKYQLKRRCIIETYNSSFLKAMKEKDLYTSFWVSKYKTDTLSKKEIDQLKHAINNTIYESKPSALSAHYSMYPFLRMNFTTKDLLLWTYDYIPPNDSSIIAKMIQDPKTKVILTDIDKNILSSFANKCTTQNLFD